MFTRSITGSNRGLRHIAVHGHQFDGFVINNVRFNYLFGTLLYLQLQKWDSKSKALTRFLDRLTFSSEAAASPAGFFCGVNDFQRKF